MSNLVRSPLNWTGGKKRFASRIVATFPSAKSYDVYCEPFCGACSVLFAKPAYTHLEAINDLNGRLMNFWLQVREEVERLQWKLDTLPYSEQLFKQYRESLNSDEDMDALEEAARWYYVNRSTIGGYNDSSKGWQYKSAREKVLYAIPSEATSYRNAIEVLQGLSERLGNVQIHSCDFVRMIEQFQSPRTLFYVDPPYHGTEKYYAVDNTARFTPEDHERLAQTLNATSAQVALSYYDCPELDLYYPRDTWRRIEWQHTKDTSHLNGTLQVGHEVLLCNYPEPAVSLWESAETDGAA